MLFSLWLLVGMVMICFDSAVQPHLTQLGQEPLIRSVAQHWQELGAAIGIVVFLLAGLAFAWKDRGRSAITFALSLASVGVAVNVLKYLVGRARPNRVHDETVFYGPLGMFNHGARVAIDAIPSGHTAAAFAMATALTWRWPRWAFLWYLLAAGVGMSRTLLDQHFPSDVILGAFLGTIVTFAVCVRGPAVLDRLMRRGKLHARFGS
jgi:membrane-associated phospholipid phosphatase